MSTKCKDCERIKCTIASALQMLAEAMEKAETGWDYEEMTPEDAFFSATSVTAVALRETADKLLDGVPRDSNAG